MHDREWKEILNVAQDLSHQEIINKIKGELEVKYSNIYRQWKDAEFDINHLLPFQSRHIGNQCTLLHISAFHGAVIVVEALLKNGANVNASDEYGSTPLHQAILSDNIDVVNALLEKGAQVNVRDQCGNTPLHHAAEDNRIDIVKALLKKGAKVNIGENIFGRNPLHWAALRGHIDVVNILLQEEGVDIDATDKFGKTPLHLVAERGHVDIAKILLAAGTKIDAIEGIFRRTPLHWAALCGNVGTVNILLESGANPLIRDKYGYTSRNLTLNDEVRQLLQRTEDKRFHKPIIVCVIASCLTAIFGAILAIWFMMKKEIAINTMHIPLVFATIAIVALVTGAIMYKLFEPREQVNAIQVDEMDVVQGRNLPSS